MAVVGEDSNDSRCLRFDGGGMTRSVASSLKEAAISNPCIAELFRLEKFAKT